MDDETELAAVRRLLAWLDTQGEYRVCERITEDSGAWGWDHTPWTDGYFLDDDERALASNRPATPGAAGRAS